MMKLVVDAPGELGPVTLVVGSLEVPLSREQVVEMLFGADVVLVAKKAAKKGHAKALSHPIRSDAYARQGRETASRFAARAKKGLCVYCGKLAKLGKKVCPKHYATRAKTIKKAHRIQQEQRA